MVISEIHIVPIKPNNGLIGFASVLLNDSLYLGSIGIHTRLDGQGLRLTYPTKGTINIFHPTTKQLSKVIEEAVLDRAYSIFPFLKNVMNSNNPYNAGHSGTHHTEK